LATLDQLGRGIGPGSTIHRRGGHTQEPDLRDPGIPEIRDHALAQAPMGVVWQLGSGIDGKLFPHQRPPLRVTTPTPTADSVGTLKTGGMGATERAWNSALSGSDDYHHLQIVPRMLHQISL